MDTGVEVEGDSSSVEGEGATNVSYGPQTRLEFLFSSLDAILDM